MADNKSEAAMQRIMNLLQVLAEHPVSGVEAGDLLAQAGGYTGKSDTQRDVLSRDLRNLRKVGCVIDNVAGEGEDARYVLRPGDDRVRLAFTREQLFELQRAAVMVGVDGLGSAVAGAAAGSGADAPIIEDLAVPAVLGDVQRAVTTRGVVRFDYSGRSRTVHPYGLRVAKRGWVLEGWEEESGQAKVFSLQRMGSVRIGHPNTASPPERSESPTLDPLRFEVDDAVPAELQVPLRFRTQVDAVLHEPIDVRPGPVVSGEQTEILSYSVTNHANFAVRVLRLDERVTLLGGDRIREVLEAMLRALVVAS